MGFSVFVVVICILNITLNMVNGRFWMSDFKVYYMAAKMLVSGGQVYLQSFGVSSGIYKYSPVILVFFLPYTLFSYQVAAILHFFILSFCFWYSYILIRRLMVTWFFTDPLKKEGLLLSAAFAFCLIHLVRELYLGNINIVLLLLCLIALVKILAKKDLQAGLILAIVFLAKPFFLLLLIPLVVRMKTRVIGSIILFIFAGLIIPFIFPGPYRSITLYHDWIKTMRIHEQGFPGMNSIDYMLRHFLYPGLSEWASVLVIFFCGILLATFIFLNKRREQRNGNAEKDASAGLSFEWFLILALLPDLVKTDSEHFLATGPLVTFLIYFIAVRRSYVLIPVLAILFFFFGANSTDLLGKDLSDRLFTMGLLGLSNLALIILSIFLFLKCII